MRYQLSVPSKTFLLGEYLALHSGPSLIINTGPRFQVEINSYGESHCEGIHPQSPAGQWIRKESQIFSQNQLKFMDPHEGQGGLGASSAQFLMVYIWQKLVESPVLNWKEYIDSKGLWESYRELLTTQSGYAPSGADVVAQMNGKITLFYQKPFQVHTLDWPFKDTGFFIIRTGNKLQTHSHLEELSGLSTHTLERCFHEGERAFYKEDSDAFCESIKEYALLLKNMGFLEGKSEEVVNKVSQLSGVKASKACGAMGADTLICLYEKDKKNQLRNEITDLSLEIVSDENDISEGLSFQSQFLNEEEKKDRP